jgi:hypothetical protein
VQSENETTRLQCAAPSTPVRNIPSAT